MPKRYSRRDFLQASLALGSGFGLNAVGILPGREFGDWGKRLMAEEKYARHIHDPVIIKAGGTYYLYSTGDGISVRTSPDLAEWNKAWGQTGGGDYEDGDEPANVKKFDELVKREIWRCVPRIAGLFMKFKDEVIDKSAGSGGQ